MESMLTRIDHVMICVANLEHGIEAYTRLGFNIYPGGVHTGTIDPTLTALYIRDNRRASITRVMSNSFGFGGTNCSLILGRAG